MTREALLIEGVGSVGGVLAAELVHHGITPILVTGNAAITAAIRDAGLLVHTPQFSARVPATAYTSLHELPPGARFSAAWLCMKAQGVQAAARDTLPWLTEDGCLVAFQNGLVEAALAEVVPPARVLRASIAVGAIMEAPGVYRRTTAQTVVHAGELDGRYSTRLTQLCATLAPIAEVHTSDNITGVLWGKLLWNCAVSGLCAVGGCTLGALVGDAAGRALFLRVYTEGVTLANALGIALVAVVVDHRPFVCSDGMDASQRAAAHAAVAALAGPYGAVLPSIVQSLARGRPTEIAWLNGELVRQALAHGMTAPCNAAITALVQAIERGEARADRAHFARLLTQA